jgi:hypothetical protein
MPTMASSPSNTVICIMGSLASTRRQMSAAATLDFKIDRSWPDQFPTEAGRLQTLAELFCLAVNEMVGFAELPV